MIKCDMGIVEISKNKTLTMTEFSMIVSAINESLIKNGLSKDEAKKEIEESVNIGLMSEAELNEEMKKRAGELSSEFGKTMAKLAEIILDQMM